MENQDWKKIKHVESSLERKPNQFAMFVGRWQPLHLSHQALFQQALNEGKNLLICIRDGEVNEKNPFSSEQVKENIEDVYALLVNSGIMQVIIIPDICSIDFGRGVGYDIIEHIPPTAIGEVSATKIREQLRADGKL
ncbi:MAG: adenylyltransferase/cytidyltransferase family protein [Flavobacterium sp.]